MKLNYQDAGVDIKAGNLLIEKIKPAVKATHRSEVISNLGGFGGLFKLDNNRYRQPILVSGTDGVGTKLLIAQQLNDHSTIGIDLVAMCVNDVLVQGAEPLFFLDYLATGKLNVEQAQTVIKGIAKGCQQAGCALIGGETAEMPSMYQAEEYDLAGFCVGIVEQSKLIDGTKITADDAIIGIASSGPHSNGYSLIRKIIEVNQVDVNQNLNGRPIGEQLLEPTCIYVKPILELMKTFTINGLAHITGGGLVENIPRILPNDCKAKIDTNSWEILPIFQWLKTMGNIDEMEMLRTFNCGIGMIIITKSDEVDAMIKQLASHKLQAWQIGNIITTNSEKKISIS